MTRRVAFIISLDVPDDVSRSEARAYVHDAVSNWNGHYFNGSIENNFEDLDPRIGRIKNVTVRYRKHRPAGDKSP